MRGFRASLRLVGLDLWRTRRAQVLTIICLSIGFFALLLSLGLRESQDDLVRVKAQELLTGDAQIHGTRPFSDEDIEKFKSAFQVLAESRETDLNASLRTADRAVLVELKAVTDSFPLIGRVQLDKRESAPLSELHPGGIWLAEDLQEDLNLKLGDVIELGAAKLKIKGWITADVALKRGATGFAPRAYIKQEDLAATQLIQPGSQVQYRLTFLLDEKTPAPKSSQDIKNHIPDWPDDLMVRTPEDAIGGIQRGISYVQNYLSLITLLLLLLGFMSGFYLIQIHLRERALSLALGLLFGARPLALEIGAVAQIFALLLSGWLIALVLVLTLFYSLNPLVDELLPRAQLILGARSIGLSLAAVAFNTLIFSLPFVARFRRLEPEMLLNHSAPTLPLARPREELMPYFLALIGATVLSAWMQQSWIIALTMGVVLLLFVVMATLVVPRMAAWRGRVSGADQQANSLSRLAWLGLSRPRLLTVLVWIALAWSATLSSIIPNLLSEARHELKSPRERDLPQFFAINIRPSDIEAFSSAVTAEGAELRHASPLVLGRLQKINDEAVKEGWISRFPVRLTYRDNLGPAEKLVEGELLPPRWDGQGAPGVSIEKEFARRNNLRIGDRLEFEVAGLPLLAQVRNIRTVDWSSFQPNFFLQFSGGVLEDFPQSLIAVIYAVPQENVLATQSRLSQKFPNLSLLNLATTLERLNDIVTKLILPILAVSLTGLALVLLMVALLSSHLWRERRYERDLFGWLGASREQVRTVFSMENFWLSGSALLGGSVLGLLTSMVVTQRIFERWTFPTQLGWVLGLALLSWLLSLLPVWIGSRQK